MPIQRDKYYVDEVDLFSIRNRNERRVAQYMQEYLESLPGFDFVEEVLMDIYASALNALPARYAQIGSIVLRDPVREDDIQNAVHEATIKVMSNPKDT